MVNRPGFTLVEVIVALTLLSVGVLGLAASAGFAAAMLASAQRLEAATRLGSVLADSLVHAPDVSAGELSRGPMRAEWSESAGLISLTVSYPDSRGWRAERWVAHRLSALDGLPTRRPADP